MIYAYVICVSNLVSGFLIVFLSITMDINLFKVGYAQIFLTWFAMFQLSTIWAETADNARSAARTFVLGGLSEKYHGISNFWVADRINVCIFYFNF